MSSLKQYPLLKITLFIFFAQWITVAKPPLDAKDILEKVRSRLDSVTDYSATVNVAVNIPNLRMPEKDLQIYYKKPDKFTVKTYGFAIVPKVGLLPSQMDFLAENTTVALRSTPDQNDSKAYILEIRTTESQTDMTTTVWIDAQRWTIEKVLFNAPELGESVVVIHYQSIEGIWLPDTTTVYLDLKRSIPEIHRPTIDSPVGFHGGRSGSGPMNGTIRLIFRDYQLNQGLEDALFSE